MTPGTMQNEWYYWCAVEEANRKKIPVKTFVGFAYASSHEINLWENAEFAKNSVAFYVFLDELHRMIASLDKNKIIGDDSSHGRLRFTLRVASLFGAAAVVNESSFSALQVHFENTPYKKGIDAINTLFVIGQQLCSQLFREMFFSDPNYFVKDIFAVVGQVQRSAVLSKIYEYAPMILDSLEAYEQSSIHDLFFDFGGEMRESITVSKQSNEFNDNQYIGLFKNGVAWIDHQENGMYTLVFTSAEDHRMVHFVEILRLYFKQNIVTLLNLRKQLLKKITAKAIEEKITGGNFFSMSVDMLKNGNEAENFLARAYNEEIIVNAKEKLRAIIQGELERHSKKLHTADKAKIAEVHKIVFSTLIEKISGYFAANTQYALLPINTKDLSGENFTRILSEIMRDAYIDFFVRGSK